MCCPLKDEVQQCSTSIHTSVEALGSCGKKGTIRCCHQKLMVTEVAMNVFLKNTYF
ncbi:hypothetical protein X975_03285, partial [Stegodyphus mimosarum]